MATVAAIVDGPAMSGQPRDTIDRQHPKGDHLRPDAYFRRRLSIALGVEDGEDADLADRVDRRDSPEAVVDRPNGISTP